MRRFRPIVTTAIALLAPFLGAQAFAQSKGTILVTGFEPFGGATVNPSWEAVKALDGRVIDGYTVEAVRIPVDYRGVASILSDLIARVKPAAYIAFGQGNPGEFSLEQVAHNRVNPALLDNTGYAFPDPSIEAGGPMLYHSTLPLDQIQTDLVAEKDTVVTSTDPGGYLCEFTFYLGKYYFQKNNLDGPMGFVHVPLPASGQTDFSQDQLGAETVVRDVIASLVKNAPAAPPAPTPTPQPSVAAPPAVAPTPAPPPPAPAPAPAVTARTLSRGDTGADVVALQDALAAAGFSSGASDGTFGEKTEQAVIAFQKKNGLPGDGIVRTTTWAALAPSATAAPPTSTGLIRGLKGAKVGDD
jgi:pyroglutamyl-peptidase